MLHQVPPPPCFNSRGAHNELCVGGQGMVVVCSVPSMNTVLLKSSSAHNLHIRIHTKSKMPAYQPGADT